MECGMGMEYERNQRVKDNPKAFLLSNLENRNAFSDLEKTIKSRLGGIIKNSVLEKFEKSVRHHCRGITTIGKRNGELRGEVCVSWVCTGSIKSHETIYIH